MKTKTLFFILLALVLSVGLTAADLPPRPLPPPPVPPAQHTDPPKLADLQLTLFAGQSQASVDDAFKFTIVVFNPDSAAQKSDETIDYIGKVRGVDVTGYIPDGFEVTDVETTKGSANFNSKSHNVRVHIGKMVPGETVTITVTGKVGPAAVGKTYTGAKVSYNNHFYFDQKFSNWVPVTVVE